MRKVPSVEDTGVFSVARQVAPLVGALLVVLLTFCYVEVIYSNSLFLIFLILILCLFSPLWTYSIFKKQRSRYWDRIRQYPLNMLIATRVSPEYSQLTRQWILVFLNNEHPGWSL